MCLNKRSSCIHDSFFASQVFASLTLIDPLPDLVLVFMMCPEISGHPIKLHLVNKKKTI